MERRKFIASGLLASTATIMSAGDPIHDLKKIEKFRKVTLDGIEDEIRKRSVYLDLMAEHDMITDWKPEKVSPKMIGIGNPLMQTAIEVPIDEVEMLAHWIALAIDDRIRRTLNHILPSIGTSMPFCAKFPIDRPIYVTPHDFMDVLEGDIDYFDPFPDRFACRNSGTPIDRLQDYDYHMAKWADAYRFNADTFKLAVPGYTDWRSACGTIHHLDSGTWLTPRYRAVLTNAVVPAVAPCGYKIRLNCPEPRPYWTSLR